MTDETIWPLLSWLTRNSHWPREAKYFCAFIYSVAEIFFVSGMPETMVKVWDIGRKQIAVKGSIVSCLDHLYVDGTPIQLAALSAGY